MAKLLVVWCFKGGEEIIFWFVSIFGFVLLFCRLLRRDFGELVSMMERDPSYSMETLYELCESRLCKGIARGLVRRFQGSEGMKRGGIYMMLAKKKMIDFFVKK